MGPERGAGVDAPGGRPVVYNRSAATSTLGFDGGDDPWHQLHLLPATRCGEEGRGTFWRRRRALPRRGGNALRRGTDALGFGTAIGEELDYYTMDGEEDGDDGLPSDMSGSYVTRDGGTTSNFSPKAVLRSTSELMTMEAAGWYWNASS